MFESAKRKLERADEHIRHFDQVFTAFSDTHRHTAIIKGDVENGKFTQIWVEIEFAASLPSSLDLILGDAIHNAHCALDHLMWELIGLDGGTQDRGTKLPSGGSRVDFEASARGAKTPRQDTKDFLVNLAVYPSGQGHVLYGLGRLNNADKHTIVTSVAQASYVSGITFIRLENGERWRTDPIMSEAVSGSTVRLLRALPGWGIDAKEEIDATPDVFFGDVEGFPREPIISTLAQISTAVRHTIDATEWFIANRGP